MKKWLAMALLLLSSCLLLPLTSCTSSSTPPQTHQTALPTTKPLPSGMVLYQANWSKGLDNWKGDRGWTTVNGQLQSNSVANISIVAPYEPPVANYAIETRVRIVRILKNVANAFTIYASDQPGKDGFQGSVNTLAYREPSLPPLGFAQVAPDQLNGSAGFQEIDFVPGNNWHTYRIEVQGNEVSLLIDGTRVSTSSSLEQAISNGPIGLTSLGFELKISSFRIVTL